MTQPFWSFQLVYKHRKEEKKITSVETKALELFGKEKDNALSDKPSSSEGVPSILFAH